MSWSLALALAVAVGVVVPLVVSRQGTRRAERELPALAQRLGLALEEGSSGAGRIGRFEGRFRGRRVVMRPDAFGLLRVALERPVALSLSTDRSAVCTVAGARPFASGQRRFDRRFPHRHAADAVAERLRGDAELRRMLLDCAAGQRGLRSFAVDAEYVSLTTKSPGLHGASSRGLEQRLAALTGLADALEARLP